MDTQDMEWKMKVKAKKIYYDIMFSCFILQHVHAVFPSPASIIQVLILLKQQTEKNEKLHQCILTLFIGFQTLKIKASWSQFQLIQVRLKGTKCHQDFSWPPRQHPSYLCQMPNKRTCWKMRETNYCNNFSCPLTKNAGLIAK